MRPTRGDTSRSQRLLTYYRRFWLPPPPLPPPLLHHRAATVQMNKLKCNSIDSAHCLSRLVSRSRRTATVRHDQCLRPKVSVITLLFERPPGQPTSKCSATTTTTSLPGAVCATFVIFGSDRLIECSQSAVRGHNRI